MQKLLVFIWLLQFSVFGASSLMAFQDNPVQVTDSVGDLEPLEFDEDMLETFRKDPAFDYEEVEKGENWWTRFKRALLVQWNRLMHWLFGDIENSSLLQFIVEVLPYLLLMFILLLVVYLFNRINPASSVLSPAGTGGVTLNEEEHIVRNLDIKGLIREAEQSGDYRLAVRYQFLYVLQHLARRGYIQYDPSKTDEDYLKELQDGELRAVFNILTRIYDFIWYGQFETEKPTYDKIVKEFDHMETAMHEQKI